MKLNQTVILKQIISKSIFGETNNYKRNNKQIKSHNTFACMSKVNLRIEVNCKINLLSFTFIIIVKNKTRNFEIEKNI